MSGNSSHVSSNPSNKWLMSLGERSKNGDPQMGNGDPQMGNGDPQMGVGSDEGVSRSVKKSSVNVSLAFSLAFTVAFSLAFSVRVDGAMRRGRFARWVWVGGC